MLNERIKAVIKKPALLFFTLGHRGFLNWMSDETFLRIAYRIKVGKKLNLEQPRTFNEKLQWLKLHDRKEIYTRLVDKYEAKKYVSSIIGEEYIIPTLGVWEKFDEIDFSKLPNQFVLKCTHDSGGLVICRDKKKLDIGAAKKKINKSLAYNFFGAGREWPYKNVKPRIIAEKYMEDSEDRTLKDYKFFCFNGESRLLYISKGLEHHPTAQISFYDMDGKEMFFHRSDYAPYHDAVLPARFDDMKKIASKLAQKVNNEFVRIDLYSINDKIYFSEVTFSPCSGMIPFKPSYADEFLGEYINIKISKKD